MRSRPLTTAALATAAAVAATVVTAALPGSTATAMTTSGEYTTNCPQPEDLVDRTDWGHRRLAPGVTLYEGHHGDSRGRVQMHVLRVHPTNDHLRLRPLVRHVAVRHRLSSYAGQRRLVAATNAGYFDLGSDAPLGVVAAGGQPLVGTRNASLTVGFDRDGLVQSGSLAVGGTISTPKGEVSLAGRNAALPIEGVTVYTQQWGSTVRLFRDAVSRRFSHGRVTSSTGRFRKLHGEKMLVARGRDARHWLRSLRKRDPVSVHAHVVTDAPRPFRLGFAVGARLVVDGATRSGLQCRVGEKQPARTAIGYTRSGRQMMLVTVDDRAGTRLHGLASVQMARLMRDLGAYEAFLLDGGGSTEMLARMTRSAKRASIRNYPARRYERPLPLGIGVYRR